MTLTSDQQLALSNLVNTQRNLGQSWVNYWQQYSNAATWQFWANLILFVGPLVVLYFVLDRKKAFRIGFYGFNVHVWFGYIDTLGGTSGLWAYPFKIFPFLSLGVSLEASFVPVVYMLLYQWTLNRKRNYYLYATVLSAVLAFVVKPVLSWLDLFQMYRWMNFFYLFLAYMVIMLLSKWVTDFFAYLQKRQSGGTFRRNPLTSEVGESGRSKWRRRNRSAF